MIVVATENFEVYHGVVGELRDRGVRFTTREPDDPLPESTDLVLTGPDDDLDVAVDVVRASPGAPRRAVEAVLDHLRSGEGRTVVGVDPGDRPGIAVLSGNVVVAAFSVPLADAADVVRREIEDAVDPVVRVGDGARLQGTRIIDDLGDVRVELVDETGTTPHLGTGARGMGDVLAAVNIAHLDGEVVHSRDIEPTSGELATIKRRSRELSDGNREIDDVLARRVATGDLTIQEALDEHGEQTGNPG